MILAWVERGTMTCSNVIFSFANGIDDISHGLLDNA